MGELLVAFLVLLEVDCLPSRKLLPVSSREYCAGWAGSHSENEGWLAVSLYPAYSGSLLDSSPSGYHYAEYKEPWVELEPFVLDCAWFQPWAKRLA